MDAVSFSETKSQEDAESEDQIFAEAEAQVLAEAEAEALIDAEAEALAESFAEAEAQAGSFGEADDYMEEVLAIIEQESDAEEVVQVSKEVEAESSQEIAEAEDDDRMSADEVQIVQDCNDEKVMSQNEENNEEFIE